MDVNVKDEVRGCVLKGCKVRCTLFSSLNQLRIKVVQFC